MQVPIIFLIPPSCLCIIDVTYFTTWEYTLYVYIYNIHTLYSHVFCISTYDLVLVLLFWTNYYMLDQLRIIKISLHFIFSCIANALPLCRSLLLIYVIFLLCEECLLALLTGKTTFNKFLRFLVWETLYFSFTFTEQFHRVQNSKLMGFFF